MKDIKFRVDEELHKQLQDLSDLEGEPTSTLVRRMVRRGVRAELAGHPAPRPAHEGSGRVR